LRDAGRTCAQDRLWGTSNSFVWQGNPIDMFFFSYRSPNQYRRRFSAHDVVASNNMNFSSRSDSAFGAVDLAM